MPPYSNKRAHTKGNIRKIPWEQFVRNELYNSTQTQGAGDLNWLLHSQKNLPMQKHDKPQRLYYFTFKIFAALASLHQDILKSFILDSGRTNEIIPPVQQFNEELKVLLE
jgi:hypothetical protein